MFLSRFEAVGTVERDVQDHDVGTLLCDGLHRGLRLFGLAANLHILLLIDQQSEPLAHERMIVHHQNRLLGGLLRVFSKRAFVAHSLILFT